MERDSLSPSLLSLGLAPSSRPSPWEQWALQVLLCGALCALCSPVEISEAEGEVAVLTVLPHERGGSEACAPMRLSTCLGLRDWGPGFQDQLAMSTDTKARLLDSLPPGLRTSQAVKQ